ncbi:MAG: ABC transporter permease [Egibacteraceae bacterium]
MSDRALRWRIRVGAFPRKEIVEIARQPILILALVFGPFLILLLFGATLRDTAPFVPAVFVIPEGGALTDRLTQLAERDLSGTRLRVVDVTSDEDAALERLREGEVGLVVVFPSGAAEAIRRNERASIVVYHDRLDPIETEALDVFTLRLVDEANQQLLTGLIADLQEGAGPIGQDLQGALDQIRAVRLALEEAQRQIVLGGGDPQLLAEALRRGAALEEDLSRVAMALQRFSELQPEVVVTPFTGNAEQIGEGEIRLADFYAPAAVALLLQHLVVTFVSLSIVREEQLGTTELFRIAPVSAIEALLGRYLAHLVIGGVIGASVLALLVYVLGVPMRGDWLLAAAAVAALLFSSIGLGFAIALVAKSDSQAVQYAMILLLASVFFSGFILTLDRFAPPLHIIARFLPVTYGVEVLRNVMLRGQDLDLPQTGGLVAIGIALFALGFVLLRRRMRHG